MMRWLLLLLACPLIDAVAQNNLPGRLFFTPEQRAEIDRQRLNGRPGERLTGEVRRSGGRNARWINGKVEWESAASRPLEWQDGLPGASISVAPNRRPAK